MLPQQQPTVLRLMLATPDRGFGATARVNNHGPCQVCFSSRQQWLCAQPCYTVTLGLPYWNLAPSPKTQLRCMPNKMTEAFCDTLLCRSTACWATGARRWRTSRRCTSRRGCSTSRCACTRSPRCSSAVRWRTTCCTGTRCARRLLPCVSMLLRARRTGSAHDLLMRSPGQQRECCLICHGKLTHDVLSATIAFHVTAMHPCTAVGSGSKTRR